MIRTIDFNALAAGNIVTDQFADLGVRIVTAATPPGADEAMVFDTANVTGGDTDLATDNLGNVLIVSEDGDASDPDDNATGGALNFVFDAPVQIKSLTFLDIEESARVLFFGADGALIEEKFVSPTADNGQSTVEFFVPGTARMEVELQGSGAIDNLVFDDATVVTPVGDGIVSGDDGADLIDINYTGDPEGDRVDAGDALIAGEAPDDDITDAQAGNDTVDAGEGDDDVYAGAGDDVVFGEAGDDLIYGDRTLAGDDTSASGGRESFNWSDAGFADGETVTTFTQDTGSVNVTFTTLSATPKTTTAFSTDTQRVEGIDGGTETVSATSSLSSETREQVGESELYELSFDTPVSNVDFNINDIDGDSVVRIQAFDAAGNPLDVILMGGSGVTLLDTDGVPGAETADSNGGYADADNPIYSVAVNIAGPVSRIEIFHEQDGPNGTSVNITDVFFTADDGVVVPAEGGNDSLVGGEGDDTIFGEAGDDTLIGGVGADLLSGGADADLFVGGNPGDSVDGGTDGNDNDTLDLSGSGPLRVVDQTEDEDGNSTSGRVEFFNEDGSVSGDMSFTEIENLILPEGPGPNDPPVAVDDELLMDEDTTRTINVLANDTDPNGDPLTLIDASSTQGDVTFLPDGTVTFTPPPDYNGFAGITYTVSDGNGGTDTGFVDIRVIAIPDAPVALDDAATTPEDTLVTIDVLANDSDPDVGTLRVTEATSPDGTVSINTDGTIDFTPAPDFTGEATINYTMSDPIGLTDTATVTVTVTPVNDAPVAVDDTATTAFETPVIIDLLGNDTDVDNTNAELSVTVVSVPEAQGTVVNNGDGTVTFTPADDFTGEATITYTVSDPDGLTDEGQALVTVTEADNRAPVTADDTAITNQGAPVVIDVLANDTDPDGDTLVVHTATSPNGSVDINDDGTITFTPAADFNGPAEITYTASDGRGGETPGAVTVSVRDGIVTGTDGDDLIDTDYTGDPEGDLVDNGDAFLPGEGPQDDIIDAGDGNDTVLAGLGDDEVSGGDGDDSIDGGVGDDLLNGDAGNDTVVGGDGSDTVIGGTGDDLIDTSGSAPLPDRGYPGVFPADPDPENDRDSVDGGDGDDTIRTGDDADTINGGAGDDVISAGIDDDIIDGGDGDDRIVGAEGSDSILGGSGNDTIYANNDPDLGLDLFEIEDDGSNPLGPDLRPDNGRDTVDGGTGNDVIFGGDDDDLLIGSSGDDLLDGGIDDDTLLGGTGNDTLLGGQGDDSLSGGQGDDSLDGGIGNDTLRGNLGEDSLNGGDGNDLLDGGAEDDVLTGGAGNDTLQGALGDDTLDGGEGDDALTGGSGDDLFLGGAGSDTMTGGNDRDIFRAVNPGDIVDGSEGGDDFDSLELEGSAPEGGRLTITYDPDNAENGVVDYFNADGSDAGQLIFTNIERVVPCFTPGTLIATPKGERKVEDLKVGDRIITRDNGMQEIRWIGRREMPGEELAEKAHLRPVLIREGALGNGLPERDMMVSPQHRVLIANDKTALYFEEREVLVAAKHLTDMEGIDVVEVSHTTYIHIMFDQHEVILSDGTWTESFQPGDMSLAGVGDASREEILELFPELATREGIAAYAAARKSLKKHEARLVTGKS
jgi:Ca2+-binding RTX toxin-like protein